MRFAVDSDFQYGSGGQERNKKGHAADIIKQGAEFMLIPGDTTNTGFKGMICCCIGNDQFPRFENDVMNPILANGIDMYFSNGNHEGAYVHPFIKFFYGGSTPMRCWLKERHGDFKYQFVRSGIRFVCLGVYPTSEYLEWMKDEVLTDLPIVLFWHFGINDGFSMERGWWSEKERDDAFDVFDKYNVLAIFVGHLHVSYNKLYKHSDKEYLVIGTGGDKYALVDINEDILTYKMISISSE